MKRIKRWIRALLWTAPLALAGCASPLQRQAGMAALSKASVVECQRERSRCREVEPCQRRTLEAIRALQAWNESIAGGREDVERAADALGSEKAAQITCRAAKVNP